MTGPELVSLELLGSDEQLSAAARSAAGPGSKADLDAAGVAEGRDESRAVTVRMSPTGRVSQVLISAWWREHLSPSHLGDALLAAYRSASGQAAAGISIPSATPSGRPQSASGGFHHAWLTEDDGAWLDGVRRRLGQVQDNLDRAERLLRDGPVERVVSGPAGYVRLVIRGESVSAVRIDVHTAMRESPNRLAGDALAAFQAIH